MKRLATTPILPEHLLYHGFVSPMICQRLMDVGLTTQVGYEWVVNDKNEVELVTRFFDDDDYYKTVWDLMHGISNNIVLPAFTIIDVEQSLPNYTLTSDANVYMVMLDKYLDIQPITAPRLADAYALMLLEGIDRRILSVEVINNTIGLFTIKH